MQDGMMALSRGLSRVSPDGNRDSDGMDQGEHRGILRRYSTGPTTYYFV